MQQSKKNLDLFTIGLMALITGSIGLNWFNLSVWGYFLYGLGIASCGYHVLDKSRGFKILWENLKLYKGEVYPILKRKKKTPYGYDLRFTLPAGLSTEDFEKNKTAIEQYLDKKIKIRYEHKTLIIEVYNKSLSKHKFEVVKTNSIVEFPVGYSFGGKIETVDLTDGQPHMLIAGETGSGKSTTLRGIITNLILTKDPNVLELHLIDLKRGAEFGIFSKCKIVKSFSRTKEEAEEILYKLSDEVDRRYTLFYEKNCVDIKEYNRKYRKNKLNYKLVIIDEFADLQNEKDSISIIETLAAKARACGIHLIISTQRPDSKILNGRIKANVPVVLGLKTMNELNSRIIIDCKGLEELKGKGHGILKYKGEVEIQAMNITPQQARDLVKPYYRKDSKSKATKIRRTQKVGEVENFDFLKVFKGGK
ncbi:FtsK/SpoIIIE domain-containing protein [Caloranaerobacter sp. DY30410]|uniref:FtsK/SpoIIIE domain-containing protein n=1 Tax=Caloranaerobacter sp. DY30410 TaxID=3238305 RepID=UPI003CFF41FC